MARQQRDSRLQSRDARTKLAAQAEPYWHELRRGLAIGYYKGPKGGSWMLREYRGGRYFKRQIGQADDTVDADGTSVLSWTHAITLSLGAERPTATAVEVYSVNDALKAYWASREAKSPTSSVATDKGKAAAHIVPVFGTADVNDIEAAQFRKFRDGLVTPSDDPDVMRRRQDSANRVWSVLRAALNLAFSDGKAIKPERWRSLRPFRNVDRPRTNFLTAAEAKRALNAMAPEFRPLAQAALYTGLRFGELMALRPRDVDDKRVNVRHSKSGKPRTVPLGSEGARFFDELTAGKAGDEALFLKASGEPWYRIDVSRRMRAASKAAKLSPPVKFHDLRRTYASLLLNEGTEPGIIRELLGHADLRMTMRAYAHLLQQTVADAVESNLPSFGFKKSNVRKLRP